MQNMENLPSHKDPLWTWKQTYLFLEERFEKDVFFMYTSVTGVFPFEVKIGLTFVFKVIWFFIAIYVTVTYYITDQQSQYLSLENNSGCSEVPIAIGSQYTLDTNGLWSGQNGHDESAAYVLVTLDDLTVTSSEFTVFMDSIRSAVFNELRYRKFRDLSYNVASMMAWQQSVDVGQGVSNTGTQTVEFTGDVSYVFERFYKVGVVSAVNADCASIASISYDRPTGVVTASFDAVSYSNNTECVTAVTPSKLGYIAHLSGPDMVIKYDLHSLIIAHAVNSKLVDMSLFTTIPDPKDQNAEIVFRGDTYALRVRVDGKFPGMDPVYCLEPVYQSLGPNEYPFGTTPICTLKVADQFVFPFFNHGGLAGQPGYGINKPVMCSCTEGTGNNDYCSEFDFMSGFMMFKGDNTSQTMHRILTMAYQYTPEEINTLSFNATFAAHRLGGLASQFPPTSANADNEALARLSDPAWRADTYAFCSNCSIFSLHTFDDFNYRINSAGVQFYNGSCNDPLSATTNWDDVGPPTQLVEDYYKCIADPFDSFVNGAGIGVGDATIVVPTLVILIIPLVHLLLYYYQSDESRRRERARFNALEHDGDDMVELDEFQEQLEMESGKGKGSVIPQQNAYAAVELTQSQNLGTDEYGDDENGYQQQQQGYHSPYAKEESKEGGVWDDRDRVTSNRGSSIQPQ